MHRQASATVDGLVLWDITPAGDRIRTRLTYQSSDELESLRLSHPDGLILRSARVLGSPGFPLEREKPGRDEWTLHVDPPLKAGADDRARLLDAARGLSRTGWPEPGAKAGEARPACESWWAFSRSESSDTAERSACAGREIGQVVSISSWGAIRSATSHS